MPSSTRTQGVLTLRLVLAAFVFWTAVALVFAVPQLEHSRDIARIVRVSLSIWWSWGLLTPFIIALERSLPFPVSQPVRRALTHLLLAPLVVIFFGYESAGLEAVFRLRPWSGLVSAGPLKEASGELFWSTLVYLLIVGVWQAYSNQQRYASAELHVARLEQSSSEAHLNALRMQLDPHFLFNALNTISAQVERDPKLARNMIEHLGDLLRLSLKTHGTQEIRLSQELAFLDHYLAIQKLRFGEGLHVQISVASDVTQALVPSLFLQPIIENAIRHGISKRARGGRIDLSADHREGQLVIRILDDGVGLPPGWTLKEQKGVGLSVTRERVERLNPNGSRFEVRQRTEGGTEVTISFPLRSKYTGDQHASA